MVEYARLPAKTWRKESQARVPRQKAGETRLEARSLFDDSLLRSRRHAVLGDWGGGGVRHFGGDGQGMDWWSFREDELDEPVSSCQTWGLRRKCESGEMACFDSSANSAHSLLRRHDCSSIVQPAPGLCEHAVDHHDFLSPGLHRVRHAVRRWETARHVVGRGESEAFQTASGRRRTPTMT